MKRLLYLRSNKTYKLSKLDGKNEKLLRSFSQRFDRVPRRGGVRGGKHPGRRHALNVNQYSLLMKGWAIFVTFCYKQFFHKGPTLREYNVQVNIWNNEMGKCVFLKFLKSSGFCFIQAEIWSDNQVHKQKIGIIPDTSESK